LLRDGKQPYFILLESRSSVIEYISECSWSLRSGQHDYARVCTTCCVQN